MALIEIKNLTTIFGRAPKKYLGNVESRMTKDALLQKHQHVLALHSINLNINAGEIFTVMGLSGSGKSTLIRHINRLIDPTAGEITINGRDILKLSRNELIALRRNRMSMVFQRFGLMPHRSVLDNAAYGLEVRGVDKKARRLQAYGWLEKVGLESYAQRFPRELSGGMQQRVGLARALTCETDILLMDEPFSALDPIVRVQLQDELVRLQKEYGKTIIFITHDLDEAIKISDRIALLQDGRIVQCDTPQDLLSNPSGDEVRAFIGSVNLVRTQSIAAFVIPAQFEIVDKSEDEAADIFLRSMHSEAVMTSQGKYIKTFIKTNDDQKFKCSISALSEDLTIEQAMPILLIEGFDVPALDNAQRFKGVVSREKLGKILKNKQL